MKIINILIFLLISIHSVASKFENSDFVAFSYHDVGPDVMGKLDPDPTAINTQYLAHHFEWLKQNGYTVVSNQTIAQARSGQIKLPPKAVSLSFDDGYESVYYQVFPLLKAYNYPATIGIVTQWINKQKSTSHQIDKKFMNWQQIKEISASPLIEIASHTHNMHHGLISNPQGNTQPAVTSRKYTQHGYETTPDYKKRIKNDLQQSKDLIYTHTQQQVKTIIWPYGSYSEEVWEIAQSLGFKHSMTLDQGHNQLHGTPHITRYLLSKNPSSHEFNSYFKPSSYTQPVRVVHVDLDYVYDPDPKQLDINLSTLLDRIKKMSINTVFLQAFADADGDGNANALYFNNSVMPVKADLFNRVAWQLRTRSNVEVYAWMPVSSFILPNPDNRQWHVQSWQGNKVTDSNNNYKRLSIFHPDAQNKIIQIYRELGQFSHFSGILFHDDGLLTDYEDLSLHALNYYRDKGLIFSDAEELINNQHIATQWAQLKTRALIDFTHRLVNEVKYYQPEIKVARNLYAMPVLNPESEKWFAQNLELFTQHYDLTAIMAMPFLENATSSSQWMTQLTSAVKKSNINHEKVLFELQTKDWNTRQPVPISTLINQIKQLQQSGFPQYGYYPDDFINNHPPLDRIYPYISLSDFTHELH